MGQMRSWVSLCARDTSYLGNGALAASRFPNATPPAPRSGIVVARAAGAVAGLLAANVLFLGAASLFRRRHV